MAIKSGYKKILFPVLLIAAAVLCALPFLTNSENVIYIYTAQQKPDVAEQKFIAALKEQGVIVKLNAPEPQNAALWFRPPERVDEAVKSPAQYNFIYSEVYNVFDWRGMKNPPVVLTPHRDLFEHYTRSNLKTALFDIKNSQYAARKFLEILNWLKLNSQN